MHWINPLVIERSIKAASPFTERGSNRWTRFRGPLAAFLLLLPAASFAHVAEHSLFIKNDGSLLGMGLNTSGQLGLGDANNRNVPTEIVASNVVAMAAGSNYSLFIKSDGSLWGMGSNVVGQLGMGDNVTNTDTPVQILPNNVIAVAAGATHSLILKADGSLWAMGLNEYGELGTGDVNPRNVPTEIVSSGVMTIARGGHHSLFIKEDGSLWAMGWNRDGQLGTDDAVTTSPIQIVANGVVGVAGGNWHSLFLKSDGSLWGMGDNDAGQLGTGNNTDSPTPVQIEATGVTAVAAAASHSFFIKTGGVLWAMGENADGQLGVVEEGDGPGAYNVPQEIFSPGVVAIDANEKHTLMLVITGDLATTGDNDYGQLGTGDNGDRDGFDLVHAGVSRLSGTSGHANLAPMVTTDSSSQLAGKLIEFEIFADDGAGAEQQVDIYFESGGTAWGGFAGRVVWKDQWMFLRDTSLGQTSGGGSIGRLIFEEDDADGERFELEIYFTSATEGWFWAYDYEMEGSQLIREFEDYGTFQIGSGSLTIDPNWEFSDDFSGNEIDPDLWSVEKDDPRHDVVQYDGKMHFILDEQADQDHMWVGATASRILPLDEDWTVQSKVFLNSDSSEDGEWRATGIELMTYNEAEDEFGIKMELTTSGVRALIPDNDDWSQSIVSESVGNGADEAYLRIRHLASARTFYMEYDLDGSENGWNWISVMTFNMETGAGTTALSSSSSSESYEWDWSESDPSWQTSENTESQTFSTTSWGAAGQPTEYLQIEIYGDGGSTQEGDLGFDEIIVAMGSAANNAGLVLGSGTFVGIVKTEGVTGIGANGATATATLLADGGSSVTGTGFLVSQSYSFTATDDLWNAFPSSKLSVGGFEVQLTGLQPGTRYYYRAYVVNGEGTNVGARKRFQTALAANNPLQGATSLGGGWFDVDWLGAVYQAEDGWCYHQELGWFYATTDGSSGNGIWVWSNRTGWLWTTPQIYPHLWEHSTGSWLYFLVRKDQNLAFFSHSLNAWVEK